MSYNLTDGQKELLREIVGLVKDGTLNEEFVILWHLNGFDVRDVNGSPVGFKNEVTQNKIRSLALVDLINIHEGEYHFDVILTGSAYEAVDSNFNSPDTSFVKQLAPLADTTNLDTEIKDRALPILSAGAANPKMWDSAVRAVTVILEERLRDVGKISDNKVIGKKLVNEVFAKNGTLASKLADDTERESYRDLYAGVVGIVRNPSAHSLVDPTPEEGGVLIVLVDLLLNKLDALR